MTGREPIFDPTMSKKKKKKKKAFILDEEGDTQTEEIQPSETKEVQPEPTEDKDLEADEEDSRKKYASNDLDDLNFFNQKQRRKKLKRYLILMKLKKVLKVTFKNQLNQRMTLTLYFYKKKKKKNVKFPDEDEILEKDEALEDEDSKKDDGISFSNQTGPAWAGSEKDYTYEELLNRVFNIMREKNPDMVAGEKRKFVMKPPQKTSFANFTDIYKLFGSIEGNNQLKQIENVLRRYIKEYCKTCHSRCSVASIKTGFQAVTGKRGQLCAKAN
uniref:Translation initiation factor IF2/IF5 domain-containing protein n=1 Tax=Aotus nancymaae TaxID=37293 RepID=A0A2K5C099_AOTNA